MGKGYALVTGASSGIGLRYARELGLRYGYDLFLVSNQEKELEETAAAIRAERGDLKVETLCMDLSAGDAADRVYGYARERGLEVEVLVNNAGILVFNRFVNVDVRRLDVLLGLHVVTATQLCRLFGEEMCRRGRGYILNMSSMTAWTALPTIAAYNATKAYLMNLSKSLWYEMRPCGVHVMAVAPGSTNTGMLPFPEGFARLLHAMGVTMEPETLVRRAIRHLLRHGRRKVYVPGAWNHLIIPILKHLPDWLVCAILRRFDGI